jgi:hypothetical protein
MRFGNRATTAGISTERCSMQESNTDDQLDLGTWPGRRAAARCSARDAESLRTIRNRKLYRACRLTWEQFCKQRVGIDRSNADAIIRNLEEFGPAFFHLAELMRISPERFRRIASAVSELGLQFDGELIPFHKAHATRLAAAVKDLAGRVEGGAASSASRLQRAQTALKSALTDLEQVTALEMDLLQRQSLHATFEHAMEKIGRLACVVPH